MSSVSEISVMDCAIFDINTCGWDSSCMVPAALAVTIAPAMVCQLSCAVGLLHPASLLSVGFAVDASLTMDSLVNKMGFFIFYLPSPPDTKRN